MGFSLFANLRPRESPYYIIRRRIYDKSPYNTRYDRRHLREIVKLKIMNDKVISSNKKS